LCNSVDIDNPEFDKAGRVHDWRNYIMEHLIILWDDLSRETRMAIAMIAQKQASEEEWD
jgi:hypothetical protein